MTEADPNDIDSLVEEEFSRNQSPSGDENESNEDARSGGIEVRSLKSNS